MTATSDFSLRAFAGLLLAIGTAPGSLAAEEAGDPSLSWPQFRGRRAAGVSTDQALPTTWNLDTGANVKWQTPIPGLAYSSPVIWGKRLFLTTAVRLEGESDVKVGLYGSPNPAGHEGVHRFQTYCLDKSTGEVLWERTAVECEPDTQRHPKGSFAASTPATDGEFLAAFFGSEGLFVYDPEGELLWSHDFGVLDAGWYVAPDAQFGYAASPVIHDGVLFIQCDVQADPFVCAMDLATGEELWRVARDEVPTWSTPAVEWGEGREQLIVNGYRHMGGYDLRTGEELWKLSGGGDVPVPTPILGFGNVYLTNGHGRWNPIYCIDLNADGVIENGFDADDEPHVVWSTRRHGTYMQTPILYRDLLFACNDSGVILCVDPETGEQWNRQRLGSGQDGFTASPVAAGGKLYFTSEYGEIHVVEASKEMAPVAVNSMGEVCMATPAISGPELFLRTRHRVVALAEGSQSEPLARAEPMVADNVSEDTPPEIAPLQWLEVPKESLPSAKELFAAHVEARGGQGALSAVESLTTQGEWEIEGIGLKGKTVSWYHSPKLYLSESDIPGMGTSRQGFDGSTAWIMNPAVGNLRLSGKIGQSIETLADWAPVLRFEEDLRDVMVTGKCVLEGRECYVVEGLDSLDYRQQYFFDAETSFLVGQRGSMMSLGGETQALQSLREYREFDGVWFATEVVVDFPDQAMKQVARILEVSYDSLKTDQFDIPEEVQDVPGQ